MTSIAQLGSIRIKATAPSETDRKNPAHSPVALPSPSRGATAINPAARRRLRIEPSTPQDRDEAAHCIVMDLEDANDVKLTFSLDLPAEFDAQPIFDEVNRALAAAAGGYTVFETKGGWMKDGRVIEDWNRTYVVFCKTVAQAADVQLIAQTASALLKMDAVACFSEYGLFDLWDNN